MAMASSRDEIERRDMSRIRPLPGAPSPTLTANRNNRRDIPYLNTIAEMQSTGFHAWGLLILRTCYSDKSKLLWEQFLARIRSEAEKDLKRKSPDLLLPLLKWDVLEDASLDGASVGEATYRFSAWRDSVSVERDGPGADHLCVRAGMLARFHFFVMVDQESIDSFEQAVGIDGPDQPPIKLRIVNAGRTAESNQWINGCQPEEEDDDDEDNDEEEDSSSVASRHDPDEGCWMWIEPYVLLEIYDILESGSGWDHYYAPPPKVFGRDAC